VAGESGGPLPLCQLLSRHEVVGYSQAPLSGAQGLERGAGLRVDAIAGESRYGFLHPTNTRMPVLRALSQRHRTCQIFAHAGSFG